MSYNKQNFIKGQILKADHLNTMEAGIEANANAVNILDNPNSNQYLTTDANGNKVWEDKLCYDVLEEMTFLEEDVLYPSFGNTFEHYGYSIEQQFILGETYKVNLDGTVYECVAKYDSDMGYMYLGNGDLNGCAEVTNDPFVLFNLEPGVAAFCTLENPDGDHTLSVVGNGYAKKPINGDYIAGGLYKGSAANSTHTKNADATEMDAFAIGSGAKASGYGAFAMGGNTEAAGAYSVAEGQGTVSNVQAQHVQGKYNIVDEDGQYAHIVGNGKNAYGQLTRSNAHTLDWNGNAEFAGDVIANGCGGESPISLKTMNEEITALQNGAVTVAVDATLSEAGKSADAKVTGDLLVVAATPSKNLNTTRYVNKTTCGVTYTVNDDNSVSLSGEATEECWALKYSEGIANPIHLLSGTYIVSNDGNTVLINGVKAYLCLYDSLESTTPVMQVSCFNKYENSFVLDQEMYGYMQICVEPMAGNVDGITLKLQLEKGNRMTEYVSPWVDGVRSARLDNVEKDIAELKENGCTGGTSVDASLSESGKAADAKITGELFGVAPAQSRNLNTTPYISKNTNGITFTINEDNSVFVSGVPTQETWIVKRSDANFEYFYLPAGTYTFSDGFNNNDTVYGYVCLYDSNALDAKLVRSVNATDTSPKVFTIDHDMWAYVQICVKPEFNFSDGVTLKMQLENGDEATEYVSPFVEGVRSTRFDDLEKRVCDIEKSESTFSVPSYYLANGYLSGRIEAVKAKMQQCMGHGDAFIFITDAHWTQNAKNSPALIKYISDNLNINKVISGGDTGNIGGNIDFADKLRKCFNGRVYHVFGNHEYFYPANGSLLAYNMSMYNDDVHTGDHDRNYYYFDNNRAHIRYIVLDSYSDGVEGLGAQPGYEEAQIAWLTSTALDVPDGWGIVVFTHHMYYINLDTMALQDPRPGGQDVLNALDAYNASENRKGEVICVVQGHNHHDRITHSTGGIPVIITACDKYMPWVEGDVNYEPWLSTRVEGTITEQAFDIVVVDRETRELHFFRIGGDAFNGIDDNPGEPVNLRTVAY